MKTSVKQQQQIPYNFTDVTRHGEAKIITGNQIKEQKQSQLSNQFWGFKTTKEKKQKKKTRLTKEVSNQKKTKS